tara:strand:- start:24070 stop:24441 length:372 start_codon:yes stop_codon:yes gene_type:complete
MLQMLLGPAVELASSFIKGKVDERKAIQEVKIKRIQSDSDWESTMADATKSSWKDEYLIILLTLPLWIIGWATATGDVEMISRVKEGFQALQELPEFYQYLLYTGVLASFGVKGADALMKMRK